MVKPVKGVTDIGTLPVKHSQMALWREGSLGKEWKGRFGADLGFDLHFDWFYEQQGKPFGFGFFETLAVIVLHHATGYLPGGSGDFRFPPPTKKEIAEGRRDKFDVMRHKGIAEEVLPAKVLDVVRDQTESGTQAPDLLMYAPDYSDWFFCEVKGPGDRWQPGQPEKFASIAEASGKPIWLLQFKWMPESSK